ncbi:MAG: L,D-transpeptidase family protein [Pseudorhodoplanes sp.]|nr:L,D-transpeptidase family protein [Pseudorhodoplanes sp.]
MAGRVARTVLVRRAPGQKTRGILICGPLAWPVALGRGGIRADKREGDGGTPRGAFRPLRLWWRADRLARPRTRLPVRPIRAADAWSEDPRDRNYNRPVRRKPGEAGDRLTREDALYDLIVEIDHNTRPRIAGRGSAVFVHLAREGFRPTAGCVGLKRDALLRVLERIGPQTRIVIG